MAWGRITSVWGIGAHLVPAMMLRYGKTAKNRWIWEFGTKIGVEIRFEKMPVRWDDFFKQKKHSSGHLELVWSQFGHSKYLVMWMFVLKNELWSHLFGTGELDIWIKK
jgi:hypothetical protein